MPKEAIQTVDQGFITPWQAAALATRTLVGQTDPGSRGCRAEAGLMGGQSKLF
jgi:hypothetical protein